MESGSEIFDARQRQRQSSKGDDEVEKLQHLRDYPKFREVFLRHAFLTESADLTLLSLERAVVDFAKSAVSGELKGEETESAKTSIKDADLARQDHGGGAKIKVFGHEWKRFVSLQLSRLIVDRLQLSHLLSLSTHNLRKIARFRRFHIHTEGQLQIPEFVLQQKRREEHEAIIRAHMVAHRAFEVDPLSIPGDVLIERLSDEARRFLSVFPHYRLTTTLHNKGALLVNEHISEAKKASRQLVDKITELKRQRRQGFAKYDRSLNLLILIRLKRLLDHGSSAEQTFFYMTYGIRSYSKFLDVEVNEFFRNRLTTTLVDKAINLARTVAELLKTQVASRMQTANLTLTQDTVQQLLSTLQKFRTLVVDRATGAVSINSQSEIGRVRRECNQVHKKFSNDSQDLEDTILARINGAENVETQNDERSETTAYIRHQIAELELRLRDGRKQYGSAIPLSMAPTPTNVTAKVPTMVASRSRIRVLRKANCQTASGISRQPRQKDSVAEPISHNKAGYSDGSTSTIPTVKKQLSMRERRLEKQSHNSFKKSGVPDTSRSSLARAKQRQKRRLRLTPTRHVRNSSFASRQNEIAPWGHAALNDGGAFRSTPSLQAPMQSNAGGFEDSRVEIDQTGFPADPTSNDDWPKIPAFNISDSAIGEIQQTNLEETVCWQYDLFRGPEGKQPVLHYCTSKAHVEKVTRLLLNERILGFDLEWAPNATKNSPIKDQVSLIQLASEERVALFHIALHSGRETEDLVAPTLKHILESPDIIKAGVAIKADCTRLEKWLGVKARGTFELSHLYKLVKFGNDVPEQVNKLPMGLATQVLDVFGMPLSKGQVRRSAWNQYLNSRQCKYAASDAYAGYQLFCELERRRLAMRPIPPRPAFAELGLPIRLADGAVAGKQASTSNDTPDVQVDDHESESGEDDVNEPNNPTFSGIENLNMLLPTTATKDKLVKPSLIGNLFARLKPRSQSADISHHSSSALQYNTPVSQVPSIDHLEDDEPVSDTKPVPQQPQPLSPAQMSPELNDAIDKWIAERALRVTTSDRMQAKGAQLRAYYLWHVHGMSLEEIAGLRKPTIKPATVAVYIAETVRLEGEPYDKSRLKHVLGMIPFGQQWRYQSLEKRLS